MRVAWFAIGFVLLGQPLLSGATVAECVDYADPGASRIVGNVDTPGCAWGVAVSGAFAYVTDDLSGLHVIDVSDPRMPRIVGSVAIPGEAEGLAVSGSYAYVASWDAGVQVVDVSQPENPRVVGSVETPGRARDVAVRAPYAYVAGWGGGFQVIDITDPSAPRIVGSVGLPDDACGVAVWGFHAYVTCCNYPWLLSNFVVIDIMNPLSPQIVGRADARGFTGVAVSTPFAYLAADYEGLDVVDITTPPSPRIVGGVDTPGEAIAVAVSGSYAYVADWVGGLQVIDISNPQSPWIVGCAVSPPASTQGIALANDLVYVTDCSQGLYILPRQCGSAGIAAKTPIFPTFDLCRYPNPASRQVTIRLSMQVEDHVCVEIRDIAGRRVRHLLDEVLGPGVRESFWDGRDDAGREVAEGVYLVHLSTSAGTKTSRVVIVK